MHLLSCALKYGEMENMTSPHGQIIAFLVLKKDTLFSAVVIIAPMLTMRLAVTSCVAAAARSIVEGREFHFFHASNQVSHFLHSCSVLKVTAASLQWCCTGSCRQLSQLTVHSLVIIVSTLTEEKHKHAQIHTDRYTPTRPHTCCSSSTAPRVNGWESNYYPHTGTIFSALASQDVCSR